MQTTNILGLDVGTHRIGIAIVDSDVSIARVLPTHQVTPSSPAVVAALARNNACGLIVVGYPRNQSGEPTNQTRFVEGFVSDLQREFGEGTIVFQDESLTSVLAEERLRAKGHPYTRGDIDAESARIILTDYLESRHG